MIYEIEPMAYECGMKPNEFWNSTYRDVKLYTESSYRTKKESYKEQIILFDALGEKLLGVLASKRPKNKSLQEIFKPLFKEKQESFNYQSIEEQIRNLRARM